MASLADPSFPPQLLPWGLSDGEKLLILGGGKVGIAIARSDGGKERCILTHTSAAKVAASNADSSLPDGNCEFRLDDEATWANLPQLGPSSSVAAVLITFALSWEKHGAALRRLWSLLPKGKVIIYGTTSVYGGITDHKCVVTESSPLTGVGVTGKPLADRGAAEEWALSGDGDGGGGATVLNLAGISFGQDKDLRGFFEKGYVSHAYAVVNYVHVMDVVSITRLLLDGRGGGQRFNVSSGAYRWKDLGEAVGYLTSNDEGGSALGAADASNVPDKGNVLPGHPEHPPPSKRSKIVSVAKLSALLAKHAEATRKEAYSYPWRSPVEARPDLEPVSRGIPTGEAGGGAGHDRQWTLMMSNFEGKWHGEAHWFFREQVEQEATAGLEQGAAGGNGSGKGGDGSVLSFAAASAVRPATTLHISFQNHDVGTWHGTGLQFAKDGEKVLSLTRPTYNASRASLQFPGVGAQVSLCIPNLQVMQTGAVPSRFGAEINFFTERARTMLIALYKPAAGGGGKIWRLDAVSISPFRCLLAEPATEGAASPVPLLELLSRANGWRGTRQAFGPGHEPTEAEAAASVAVLEAPFDAAAFLARKQQKEQPPSSSSSSSSLSSSNGAPLIMETFMDGGFVVLPEELRPSMDAPATDCIELTFGTLHGFPADSPRLRAVTLAYTNGGQDVEWRLEEYSPP